MAVVVIENDPWLEQITEEIVSYSVDFCTGQLGAEYSLADRQNEAMPEDGLELGSLYLFYVAPGQKISVTVKRAQGQPKSEQRRTVEVEPARSHILICTPGQVVPVNCVKAKTPDGKDETKEAILRVMTFGSTAQAMTFPIIIRSDRPVTLIVKNKTSANVVQLLPDVPADPSNLKGDYIPAKVNGLRFVKQPGVNELLRLDVDVTGARISEQSSCYVIFDGTISLAGRKILRPQYPPDHPLGGLVYRALSETSTTSSQSSAEQELDVDRQLLNTTFNELNTYFGPNPLAFETSSQQSSSQSLPPTDAGNQSYDPLTFTDESAVSTAPSTSTRRSPSPPSKRPRSRSPSPERHESL